ncbi:hypothetical protein [Streptomyces sp. B21-083]|uniref:hypothetical protein n=1 Tax=Streptomyces sp. B21-083 TaxID=3039410 RepID=UPI002FF36D5A
MTTIEPKPWALLLELASLLKQLTDRSPELAVAILTLPALAKATPHPEAGTSLPGNRFYLGQRVQVAIDELDLFPGVYRARAGDLGTVTNVPTDTDPDYGVVLDNNPTGKRHAFGDDDLADASTA